MKLNKYKKFWKEWKWAILLLSFCIAGIPLSAIFGIQSVSWGNDFWPNAMSELLGMFVDLIFGAIFTFVVIDKYLQYHKNKQWKKIERITYKNLYFALSNILLKLNLSLPKEMRAESYVLTEDIETLNDYLPKDDFDIIIDLLSQNIDKFINEKHPEMFLPNDVSSSFEDEQIHTALVNFKTHTKFDIISISSLVIPKLLNFSDEQDLLDNVIELEEVFTSLMSKINNVHRKNSNGFGNHKVKYIWLVKIQEILSRIKDIAQDMQSDIDVE